MRLKDLRSLKQQQESRRIEAHFPYLIVGSDITSVLLWEALSRHHGEEKVAILPTTAIGQSSLYFRGPSIVRGENSLKLLKILRTDWPEEKELSLRQTVFYKDQKFYPFGGRVKPLPLHEGEDAFIPPCPLLAPEEIFPPIDPDLLQRLQAKALQYQVKSITLKQAEKQCLVECYDGSTITCDQLFFAEGPARFAKLLREGNQLSDEFHQFCSESQSAYGLIVEFEAQRPITDQTETMFLPQSLTHDWGHFIGEFGPKEGDKNTQRFRFFSFIKEEESTAEDITKKVKLLKRVLGRIFVDFDKTAMKESYHLRTNVPTKPVRDDLWPKIREELQCVHFIGPFSPIDPEFLLSHQLSFSPAEISEERSNEISGGPRALYSYKHVLENFLR